MTTLRISVVTLFLTCLSAFALAQSTPPPPRVAPADAKNHMDEMVVVCGKVVDNKVSKYGLAGRGKPVTFDIDQPDPNPVFFFVAFGTKPAGPEEVIAAYQGKNVCVTGKITEASGVPYIMVAERTQVKLQGDSK